MVRLVYVILISAPIVFYYVLRSNYVANHVDNYSEEMRYSMVQRMIGIMKHNGRIDTAVYGADNLPEEGGYVMYPNHQGKYDALGIIWAHEAPCTFVIDAKRSEIPFAREYTKLLEASRLDKTDPRSQVRTINEVIRQVGEGRRYIIFPEGGYNDNNNEVHDFLPGTFKCSVKSKAPIVPVALVNSYRVFGINSLRRVKTQVHFLEPLYYEDYKGMTTAEIAELVQNRISDVVAANS